MQFMDRKAVNARFINLFRSLEASGRIKKNSPKGSPSLNKSQIALHIMGKPHVHVLQDYLTEKRLIKFEEAIRFAELFGINKSFILEGQGAAYQENNIVQDFSKNDYAELPFNNSNKILFAPIEAFASSAQDAQAFHNTETEIFQIPGLHGNYIAFTIRGNSMQPTIQEGDIVICTPVYYPEDLKNNQIYAISINGAVMVKRIQKIVDKNRRVIKLKFISDNYLEHDPFIEAVSPMIKFWKVEKRITNI